MNEDIPNATLRTMGALLIAIYDIAREGVTEVVERLRPLVEPPENLRVTSPVGAFYTGLLVVERNVVIAGIVIEVGRVVSAAREPVITPPPRYDERGRFERHDEREGRLPGWAEDPRDIFPDEDPPWRRR
jgi:hypothetical protein